MAKGHKTAPLPTTTNTETRYLPSWPAAPTNDYTNRSNNTMDAHKNQY